MRMATVMNDVGVTFTVEVLTTPDPAQYTRRDPDGRPVPVVRFTERQPPHRRVAEYYADTLLEGRRAAEIVGLTLQGQVRGWHLDGCAARIALSFVEDTLAGRWTHE